MAGHYRGTITRYEALRKVHYELKDMFSSLSGQGFYVQANAVSAADKSVRIERERLHPEYIEAKNRVAGHG